MEPNSKDDEIFDDYDGGKAPPPEYIEKLLESAPPEVRTRAEAWAKQQAEKSDSAENA